MADKTFNLKVIGSMQGLKELLDGSLKSLKIPDGVTSLSPYRFYNFLQLTDLDFNQVEMIPPYICSGCPSLVNVIFSTHTTQIDDYAFHNCSKFRTAELPHTLRNVGQYAFYKAGSYYGHGNYTFTMINNVGVHTTLWASAFRESHLSEITAYLNDVSQYAFSNCLSLTKVDVEIHGSLDRYAFMECRNVMDFKINPNSVITDLGDGVFRSLGYQTYSNTNFHMADFDFRNSTFTSLPSNVWAYCCFNGNVYLPPTLETISGNFLSNATGNWKFYFNSIPKVSSSSYLRSDSSNFTVKYLFPYELMGEASSATNWSSHTSQMVGYGTGFEAGSTLPQYTRGSGVAITWYSDAEMTNAITTSSSVTDIYYCSLGSTRLVWYINAPKLHDASVTISDGTNTYTAGDPVLVNTSITITPAYTDPSINVLYMLKINDIDYASSGTATIRMNQDLAITAMYWDGEHQLFLPTLADTSWDMIKVASKMDEIPSTWNVGDTKTLTYNGQTYTARLVDKTGKFTRVADGSTAYLYFELTELLTTTEVFNSNYDSNSASASSLLTSMNSGTIWNNLDAELKSVLEEVSIPISSGGKYPVISSFGAKVFLGREHDLFSTRNYSSTYEWDVITAQDEYYQTYDTDIARKKIIKDSSNENSYWLMSPVEYSEDSIVCVNEYGSSNSFYVSDSSGVALRFAL